MPPGRRSPTSSTRFAASGAARRSPATPSSSSRSGASSRTVCRDAARSIEKNGWRRTQTISIGSGPHVWPPPAPARACSPWAGGCDDLARQVEDLTRLARDGPPARGRRPAPVAVLRRHARPGRRRSSSRESASSRRPLGGAARVWSRTAAPSPQHPHGRDRANFRAARDRGRRPALDRLPRPPPRHALLRAPRRLGARRHHARRPPCPGRSAPRPLEAAAAAVRATYHTEVPGLAWARRQRLP